MILKILLLVILIFILLRSIEPMACKDIVIHDPPIASVYDVEKENNKYKNDVFDKQYKLYKTALKTYFSNLKKYCNI